LPAAAASFLRANFGSAQTHVESRNCKPANQLTWTRALQTARAAAVAPLVGRAGWPTSSLGRRLAWGGRAGGFSGRRWRWRWRPSQSSAQTDHELAAQLDAAARPPLLLLLLLPLLLLLLLLLLASLVHGGRMVANRLLAGRRRRLHARCSRFPQSPTRAP